MSEPKRPHPKALAFRERLSVIVNDAIHDAAGDEKAYASIVGMLFAEAAIGCAKSGVPLDDAFRMLAHCYGGDDVQVACFSLTDDEPPS